MTKGKLYTAVLLLIIGFKLQAQDKPFRFGFKIAPNIAWISPDTEDYSNEGAVMGLSWGFIADFAIAENYFIKTGFNYDYLNGKLAFPYLYDTANTGTMNRRYNLRYLELPLEIKMCTNHFGKIVYFGEIGLGTAFNLRAKSQDDLYNEKTGTSESEEKDINEQVAFMKESLILGAGVEYYLDDKTSLMFGLTFNSGLTDILTGNNTRYPDVKENGNLYYFQLNIGIIF